MNLPELRDLLYSALAELLVGNGFRRIKKGEGKLIRKFKGGFHVISFAISDYRPVYRIGLLVQIRLDEVANIFCHFFDVLPSYRADTSSAVLGLRDFVGATGIGPNDDDIEITCMEDVVEVIRFLTPIVEEKIVPLLDRCTDVRSLDQLMNSGSLPGFGRLDNIHADSLIVARLADNPDFERLARKFELAISGYSDDARAPYSRLIEFLKAFDPANPPALPEPKKVEASAADWPVGQAVKHHEYGFGTVVRAQGRGDRMLVRVDFGKRGVHNMGVGMSVHLGSGPGLEKV